MPLISLTLRNKIEWLSESCSSSIGIFHGRNYQLPMPATSVHYFTELRMGEKKKFAIVLLGNNTKKQSNFTLIYEPV